MPRETLDETIELTAAQSTDALGTMATYATVSLEELETQASHETARVMLEILLEHPEMEIRIEQLEALDALEETQEAGIDRGLIHMATGLGKTTVAAIEARRFLDKNPGKRILWLSDNNDINDQARKRFESIIGPGHTFGNFTGEERDYHEVTCLFASFQVMRDWREAFLKDEFAYIIVDESHHAKANTYEPTLRYFTPEFLLGITGTPDRHDLRDIREIFGQEIYKLSLEEAIARGLLAEVDYRVITDDIQDLQKLRDEYGKKLNIKQLNRSIFAPKRDEEIINIINEHSEELDGKPRRIIFCPSVEYTEHLASMMPNARPLHSKLPGWEQNDTINAFRTGDIETILAVDMFNEGLDIPEANQVVFLRSTQSKTIFLQQLGRGLRKTPYKQKVQVLDLVANCDRLAMLDEFWEDVEAYANTYGPNEKPANIQIKVGNIDFSESARDILEILAEIESNNSMYRNWGPEDSKNYYRSLCDRLGRVASFDDVIEAHEDPDIKGPSYAQLTKRYFNHRLSELRKACGIEAPQDKELSSSESVEIYRRLSGTKPLGRTALQEALFKHRDMPTYGKLLAPFGGDIKPLQEAAGYTPIRRKPRRTWEAWNADTAITAYVSLTGGEKVTARELERRLSDEEELPSLSTFLSPYDGKLSKLQEEVNKRGLETASQPKEHKYRRHDWSGWTAGDSARVYRQLSGDTPLAVNELERILREEYDELPSIRVILQPFDGKVGGLQEAAGYGQQRKDRTIHTEWTQEDSTRLFNELSGDTPLDIRGLNRKLREGEDLPAISTVLKPFNGKFGDLLEAAGHSAKRGRRKKQ